jgi:hypothetical protein
MPVQLDERNMKTLRDGGFLSETHARWKEETRTEKSEKKDTSSPNVNGDFYPREEKGHLEILFFFL